MSLYRKYRPPSLDKIVGNSEIITTLGNMLNNPKTCPHVFLFHGPTGCGKTTLARIVAKVLKCNKSNYIEIDTAQFTGIDTVREIKKNSQFTPLGGGIRVYVIDEVHKMTTPAQNGFLKILEDTPEHIYFILCTTDPQSLLPTLKGRCSQFQVNLLTDNEMEHLLLQIIKKEKDDINNKVLKQIIQDSQGHPRNALVILEQVLATPKKNRLKIAEQAAIEQSQSIALCKALIAKKGWNTIKTILKGLKGQEPEGIRRLVLAYTSSALLNKDNTLYGLILEEFIDPFYDSGFPRLVYACYSVTKN